MRQAVPIKIERIDIKNNKKKKKKSNNSIRLV